MTLSERWRAFPVMTQNGAVLVGAIVLFFAAYSLLTGYRNDTWGLFYEEGRFAEYALTGPLGDAYNTDALRFEVTKVSGAPSRSTVRITRGDEAFDIVVDTATGKIVDDPLASGKYLLFYYDCPVLTSIRGNITEALYAGMKDDGKLRHVFAPYFTPFSRPTRFEARTFSDSVLMHYQDVIGPQFSWRLFARDRFGNTTAEIINDQTSGLLLSAKFYTGGALSTIELTDTDRFYTSANRYVVFVALNVILIGWGIFHLVRLKRRPDAQYFPMTPLHYARFFIRILAFTTFDFMGMGWLTGDLTTHMISDIIGFFAMLFAVGPYAFMVLFKFTGYINGVQYPFGVPLYFAAVASWELARLYRQRKGNAQPESGTPA